MDCSRFSRFRWAGIVRFSLVVGWTVRACGYVALCYGYLLGLPLTAPFLPISLDASPFHQICRVQEYRKTAFVRLKLQENRYPIQYKLLTIQPIPYRYQPKQTTYSRSAQILQKTIAKTPRSRRHERSPPPIMKNVRYQPNTPTETRTIPARTQKAAQHSELGINGST